MLLVVSQTFGFTAADDAFASERSALIGDHRALPFPPPTVVIEHDPIAGQTHLVRPRSVREQRRIVAFAPLAVQHRQPRLAGWIKAPRCDPTQPSGSCLLPILAIDVQQFLDGGLIGG